MNKPIGKESNDGPGKRRVLAPASRPASKPTSKKDKAPLVAAKKNGTSPDEERDSAPQQNADNQEASQPTFADLGLSDDVLQSVIKAGFESPTPIQARAIPVLMQGKDLIGQAQTGTGKTAAFALPLIERVDASARHVQALIMVPTRELAVQVAGQLHLLSKERGLRVVPVYGGQPIDRQFRALGAGAQVVVGTPGRVLDHLRRGSLDLSKAAFCALDEADEMLAFGFIEDIEAILAELPTPRQVALFSATMPPRISNLARKFMPDAVTVAIKTTQRTVDTVEQAYYEVAPGKKQDALARVLDMETPGPTIIFCRTRAQTDELAEALRLRGYGAESLHGEMAQAERDRVMRRFRDGLADLLIATDVAARGLDIDTVTHVINYDLPWDVEQYIHRIGRTGRAGRTGDAITLIEPRERRNLRMIEQAIGARINPARIPTVADISARRRENFRESLRSRLEKGEYDGQLATVEALASDFDPAEIAAVALQMLWEQMHGTGRSGDEAEEIASEGGQPEAGMTKLFVAMGRQDGLRPADLVGIITRQLNLPPRSVGAIDILDRSAFVEIPTDATDDVLNVLNKTKLYGRALKAGIARPRDKRPA